MRTLEERLYNAYRQHSGCKLSVRDVESLCQDDAVATRISNQAAREAGIYPTGDDCLGAGVETWYQLKKRLARV